jgi:hypothetical protein
MITQFGPQRHVSSNLRHVTVHDDTPLISVRMKSAECVASGNLVEIAVNRLRSLVQNGMSDSAEALLVGWLCRCTRAKEASRL